jgi:hypothetical protein
VNRGVHTGSRPRAGFLLSRFPKAAALGRQHGVGGSLKVFRGFVTMNPNDSTQKSVRPAMTHFFYMDERDPSKVAYWYGSVGPVAF